ncbi:hypothetical protein NKI54_10460 [Mesorhizobium sp. M0663]|uniref:hypothetical protein n=1 Tax=unclassified Mesorhizobium TaxID=325217 RepID=UPI0033383FD0
MQTKVHQRFVARIAAYETDLELSNVLLNKFINQTPDSNQTVAVAINANPHTHQKLDGRVNTKTSRKIVGIHLKRTVYGSFIKDAYEDFGEFLTSIVGVAALAGFDPARIIGDLKVDIKLSDLLATGSWNEMIKKVSETIFRSLENERSTIKLIEKIDKRLGLELTQVTIDAAMPFLDARHIIVHNDGKIDAAYTAKYAAIAISEGRIKLDFPFVNDARHAICALARHIDDQVQAKGLCRATDLVA